MRVSLVVPHRFEGEVVADHPVEISVWLRPACDFDPQSGQAAPTLETAAKEFNRIYGYAGLAHWVLMQSAGVITPPEGGVGRIYFPAVKVNSAQIPYLTVQGDRWGKGYASPLTPMQANDYFAYVK